MLIVTVGIQERWRVNGGMESALYIFTSTSYNTCSSCRTASFFIMSAVMVLEIVYTVELGSAVLRQLSAQACRRSV